MKKIFFTLIFLSSLATVQAQSIFQLGLKGGLLINSSELKCFQTRVRLPLGFLLQPEIVYSRTIGTFPIDASNGGGGEYGDQLKIRSNWIEVPVLVGWKFSIVRLMVGPSFRFPMDAVLTAGTQEAKVAPRLQHFVLGYQAGIGLDLGRLTIDARYCGNFTNITDGGVTSVSIPNLKVNEQKVAISLGYMLIK